MTLGNAVYAAHVTVTGSGAIEPAANGLSAVYGALAGDALVNRGIVLAGPGGMAAAGPPIPPMGAPAWRYVMAGW